MIESKAKQDDEVKRVKQKTAAWALLLLTACFLWVGSACAESIRGWTKEDRYQYVHIGTYPQKRDGTVQPVLWRVLDVTDDQALLLMEYVMDVYPVILEDDPVAIAEHTYRHIETIEDSDLYVWMNGELTDTLFSPEDKSLLIQDRGSVFLLTDTEYCTSTYGFTTSVYGKQKTRQCKATEYAVSRGMFVSELGTSGYWANAVKSPTDHKMQIVGYDGHLSYGGYTRKDLGIRVAAKVDLTLCDWSAGTGAKDDPFVLTPSGNGTNAAKADEAAATADPVPTQAAATAQPIVETPAPIPTQTPEAIAAPAAQAESIPPEKEADAETLLISFVGDCSTGETYQAKGYENSFTAIVDNKGFDWPFSLAYSYLSADDLSVGNLEVVLTERKKHSSRMYNLVAEPRYVGVLEQSGIDIWNTVNNHCLDFMREGYQDTLDTLDAAGIPHFGTMYPDTENAFDSVPMLEIKGVQIGFVGLNYPNENDVKHIQKRIDLLKTQGADLVIVSLHWGREEHTSPVNAQIKIAQMLIDGGADVIYGHHPHILQPIHFYQGKPIFYSTGNFTFGTMSRVDPDTGIFQLSYHLTDQGAELAQLQVIPMRTQGSGDYRPYPLTDESEQQALYKKLVMKKETQGLVNPPASFLETGIVRLDAGEILP